MFVFCVFFAFDRVCVYRAQIVLAEQVYWFHLDLRHLGGDLLVNRLVHELRWVHLLVCNNNNIVVNLGLGSNPQTFTGRAWQVPRYVLWRKICFSISPFFPKVPTLFFAAFLAHMAAMPGAHCYQTDAIYAKAKQCWKLKHEIQYWAAPYHSSPSQVKVKGCFGISFWCAMHLTATLRSDTNDRVKNL